MDEVRNVFVRLCLFDGHKSMFEKLSEANDPVMRAFINGAMDWNLMSQLKARVILVLQVAVINLILSFTSI